MVESARIPVDIGEVVARAQCVGVVGSQDVGASVEGLLEQGDGFVESARIPVGDGEVVARGQGVGVVGSQEAFGVFEGLLV